MTKCHLDAIQFIAWYKIYKQQTPAKHLKITFQRDIQNPEMECFSKIVNG